MDESEEDGSGRGATGTLTVIRLLPGAVLLAVILGFISWQAAHQDYDLKHLTLAPASFRSTGNTFIDDALDATTVTVDDRVVSGTAVKTYTGDVTGAVMVSFDGRYSEGIVQGTWTMTGTVRLASGRVGTVNGSGPVSIDGLTSGGAQFRGKTTITWSTGPANTYDLSYYPLRLARGASN